MEPDLPARAKLALAVAAQHAADLCRGVIGDLATPMMPGERIRKARRARIETMRVTDLATLCELAEGQSWETVAEALGLDEDEARDIYEDFLRQWQAPDRPLRDGGDFALGTLHDADPVGTAAFVDSWWERHTEPWDAGGASNPVGRALGVASDGDS